MVTKKKDGCRTEKVGMKAKARILGRALEKFNSEYSPSFQPSNFWEGSSGIYIYLISSSQKCPLCPLVSTRYMLLKLFSKWKYMKNFITLNMIFHTQKTNTLAENNSHYCPLNMPHPSTRKRLVGNKKVIQL